MINKLKNDADDGDCEHDDGVVVLVLKVVMKVTIVFIMVVIIIAIEYIIAVLVLNHGKEGVRMYVMAIMLGIMKIQVRSSTVPFFLLLLIVNVVSLYIS